jgi:hypothetical protein
MRLIEQLKQQHEEITAMPTEIIDFKAYSATYFSKNQISIPLFLPLLPAGLFTIVLLSRCDRWLLKLDPKILAMISEDLTRPTER